MKNLLCAHRSDVRLIKGGIFVASLKSDIFHIIIKLLLGSLSSLIIYYLATQMTFFCYIKLVTIMSLHLSRKWAS